MNPVAELESPAVSKRPDFPQRSGLARHGALLVVAIAAVIYCTGMIGPPSLMDDVDSAQAQIARNMLASGDFVSARMDGVLYLEKSPLIYWLMAGSFRIFGLHDWAARIPIALGTILLCWLTFRIANWAFGEPAGLYAGLTMTSSVGLYIFTRVLIPDVLLTLAITLALFSYHRALEPDEERHWHWALTAGAAVGIGVLLKGLIAIVFPVGAELAYLAVTRQLFLCNTWRRLHPLASLSVAVAIAAPWHVLATLRNPPHFYFSMMSRPGEYHGFFWFYFFNEHILRFLNRRYPHDYNTVPVALFWILNLVWLFPFVFYLPGVIRQPFRADDRAGRMRILALCWIAVVIVFFSFSTTQEYYSMPIYPALALLIGSTSTLKDRWQGIARRSLSAVCALCGIACLFLLWTVRNLPAPGDIAQALSIAGPGGRYTLSMGHALDLTVGSFAYLRLPLAIAGIAFVGGAVCALLLKRKYVPVALACMMLMFFQAAHLALVVFDPYLSSHKLAADLKNAAPGQLISDGAYYNFASAWFYSDQKVLILNGRVNNLVYGSYAPGSPDVFINDAEFKQLWNSPQRYYMIGRRSDITHVEDIAGQNRWFVLDQSGAKYLVSNIKP